MADPTCPPRRLVRELPLCDQPHARLLATGVEGLATRELLALILATPDALDLADEIMARVGVDRLLNAAPVEFAQVPGIGPALAARLTAALALGRRLSVRPPIDRPQVKSPADAANLLMGDMAYFQQEHLRVLLLDTKNYVLNNWRDSLYRGSLNSSVVRVAEIFREAIRFNAAAVLVAHNHPSGDPTPSPEDIRVTRDVRLAGELLGIPLLDHLVIGAQRYVSLKERDLGF